MAFCKNCGTQLNDKSVFCQNCGTKIDVSSTPNPDVSEPVPEAAISDVSGQTQEYKSDDVFVINNKTVAEKKTQENGNSEKNQKETKNQGRNW